VTGVPARPDRERRPARSSSGSGLGRTIRCSRYRTGGAHHGSRVALVARRRRRRAGGAVRAIEGRLRAAARPGTVDAGRSLTERRPLQPRASNDARTQRIVHANPELAARWQGPAPTSSAFRTSLPRPGRDCDTRRWQESSLHVATQWFLHDRPRASRRRTGDRHRAVRVCSRGRRRFGLLPSTCRCSYTPVCWPSVRGRRVQMGLHTLPESFLSSRYSQSATRPGSSTSGLVLPASIWRIIS